MKNIDNEMVSHKLVQYIALIIGYTNSIPVERKILLRDLASYISKKSTDGSGVKLLFICTHNSRRSHLAQVWAQVAAYYYRIENVCCYSGGTEATAFNTNAVKALEKAGLNVKSDGRSENPTYSIKFALNEPQIAGFSKVFTHSSNPDKEFAAIMTCSDADEACPFVPGSEKKISLPYEDPKKSDGTGKEEEVYDQRCMQIATEMFYVMGKV